MTTPNPHRVPSRTINVTPEVIASSQPGTYGACLLAQAIRMRLGAQSVHVTADFIKFNALGPDHLDGDKEKLMRYTYPTPAAAGAKAVKFDIDADEFGNAYARGQVEPFKFILQGERADSRPFIPRPLATKRGPTRNRSTQAELATKCKRRHKGITTYVVTKPEVTSKTSPCAVYIPRRAAPAG